MKLIFSVLVLAASLLAQQKNVYELKTNGRGFGNGNGNGNGGGDSSSPLLLWSTLPKPEQACVYGPFRVTYPDGRHWEIGVGGYVCMPGHAHGRTFLLTFGYSSFICDEDGDVFLPFGYRYNSTSIREFNNGVR